MVTPVNLEFCYKEAPVEAPALWGCRAIYAGRFVDLPWDRSSVNGHNSPDIKALLRAVLGTTKKRGALRSFFTWIEKNVGPARGNDDARSGVYFVKGVAFHYRAAGGYLYVTAVLASEAT